MSPHGVVLGMQHPSGGHPPHTHTHTHTPCIHWHRLRMARPLHRRAAPGWHRAGSGCARRHVGGTAVPASHRGRSRLPPRAVWGFVAFWDHPCPPVSLHGGVGRGEKGLRGSRRRSHGPAARGGHRAGPAGVWAKHLAKGISEKVRQKEFSSLRPRGAARLWGLPLLPQTHTLRVPRENRRGVAYRRGHERNSRPTAQIQEGPVALGASLCHGDLLRYRRGSALGWCRGVPRRSGDGAANGPIAARRLPLTLVGPAPMGPTLVGPTSATPGFHCATSITSACRDGEPTSCRELDDAVGGAQPTPVPQGSASTLIPGPSFASTPARRAARRGSPWPGSPVHGCFGWLWLG